MNEWPLVLFTLATQLACGLTLAATVFDAAAPSADAHLMRPLAVAIFPPVAAPMLASMAHLGRPLMSWRAVINARRSRLSLEVILTALFALAALVYSGFWWTATTSGRSLAGVAASAAGIAAVVAAAAVYRVPARPVWNSGWVPASFFGTSVLLGGLIPALLIRWRGNAALLRLFLGAAVAGGALLLVTALWMAAKSPVPRLWLGCHIALTSVLPVTLAFQLWPAERAQIAPLAVSLLVVAGAAIGRGVMYWLGSRYEPF
jgi:anaerobic dimethyl sulfoxide reductase subunit C